MAPEVYRHEDYNETVDIYSFSMILFYLFVGRPPWPHLPGDEAVRKASEEGDRPTLPRDMDQRLVTLLKECWDDNASLRPPFAIILENHLASYVRSVFHHDTNNVVVSATTFEDDQQHGRCSCNIM
jgi:serine/threonine protein kinase